MHAELPVSCRYRFCATGDTAERTIPIEPSSGEGRVSPIPAALPYGNLTTSPQEKSLFEVIIADSGMVSGVTEVVRGKGLKGRFPPELYHLLSVKVA